MSTPPCHRDSAEGQGDWVAPTVQRPGHYRDPPPGPPMAYLLAVAHLLAVALRLSIPLSPAATWSLETLGRQVEN